MVGHLVWDQGVAGSNPVTSIFFWNYGGIPLKSDTIPKYDVIKYPSGPPCGVRRELMVQFMPGKYKDTELMIDHSSGQGMKTGELAPEWWIE